MHITGNDTSDNSTASKGAASEPTQTQTTDPELLFEQRLRLFEQRLGNIMADNDRLSRDKKDLEEELCDLHNRLARLQENNVSCISPNSTFFMLNAVRTSYKND